MNIKNINIKKLDDRAILPVYSSKCAAGSDLHAVLDTPVTLKTGERALIKTGLSIELPGNLVADVRPRSGLAYKYGVTVLNAPGTIDADYRGDVGVILINHGKEDFTINHHDRIAQLVILPYILASFEEVNELNDSDRGEKGFGSTGLGVNTTK